MKQSNETFTIKHKPQTLEDFQKDIHRFSVVYNGKETEAQSVGSCSVFFDDESIPENVQGEMMDRIYDLIDQNEDKWSTPNGAQEIADAYCKEEFKS